MAHVSRTGAGGRMLASARSANSIACSGRASGRIAGHWAIMVGSWMTTQACSVCQPSSFGSPGPNSPAACPSAIASAEHRRAVMEIIDDRRPHFLDRDLHDLVHPRVIGHLVAHQAVQRHHHRRNALRGRAGPVEFVPRRLQEFAEQARANRLIERLLGGEEPIDIGARHPRLVGDVGDGRPRPELPEKVPGDGQDAGASLFGAAAFDDGHFL